jgi:hypothetical protein
MYTLRHAIFTDSGRLLGLRQAITASFICDVRRGLQIELRDPKSTNLPVTGHYLKRNKDIRDPLDIRKRYS